MKLTSLSCPSPLPRLRAFWRPQPVTHSAGASDPDNYSRNYEGLKHWVLSTLERYRQDLERLLFPAFAYLYLEMVKHSLCDEAQQFFTHFQADHCAAPDLQLLESLNSINKLESPSGRRFLDSRIKVPMSRYALQLLMSYLEAESYSLTFWVVNKYVEFQITEEVAKSKAVLLDEECKLVRNDTKLVLTAYGEDVKAARMYVPRASQWLERRRENDIAKRHLVTVEKVPFACFHTVLNTSFSLLCTDISEDGQLLLGGFEDCLVRLWDMSTPTVPVKKSLFEAAEHSEYRTFVGHSGAVFAVKFSPCSRSFISAGEDGCIRLWSLVSLSPVAVLKGHIFPIWTLSFCLQGFYFASGGADQTARLWSTDSTQALRVFVGHLSDICAVRFHPNGMYLSSASADKTVRLWQLASAECVRILSNHCDSVTALEFAYSGKVLFSADDSGFITSWNLSDGSIMWEKDTKTAITGLSSSHSDAVLTVASEDCHVTLLNPSSGRTLGVYATKESPVLSAGFTWRDLLLAVGVYQGSG